MVELEGVEVADVEEEPQLHQVLVVVGADMAEVVEVVAVVEVALAVVALELCMGASPSSESCMIM